MEERTKECDMVKWIHPEQGSGAPVSLEGKVSANHDGLVGTNHRHHLCYATPLVLLTWPNTKTLREPIRGTLWGRCAQWNILSCSMLRICYDVTDILIESHTVLLFDFVSSALSVFLWGMLSIISCFCFSPPLKYLCAEGASSSLLGFFFQRMK